jgi:hypothetical protein
MSWTTRIVVATRLLLALSLSLSCAATVVSAQAERVLGPPYTTCGPECQRQVKILEGFFVLVIIGFAVGVGVCCLKAIDTPTSQAGQGHHDHYQAGGGGGGSSRSKKRD